MTIREATCQIIRAGRYRTMVNKGETVKDKEIAKELGISAVTFSRLSTGVQTPNIQVWYKLVKWIEQLNGEKWTKEQIINKLDP